MGIVRLGCAAAALVLLCACGSEEHRVDSPRGATNMQPAAPSEQDHGWAALVEADREIGNLSTLRDQTADPVERASIDHEIIELRAGSDRLLDDMSIGDGRVHDAAIRVDVSNLHRAMNADAATEKQRESPER